MNFRIARCSCLRGLLLQAGLDGCLKSLWIRTYNLVDFLAVLEQNEGRHGANAKFLCNIRDIVDVDLVETARSCMYPRTCEQGRLGSLA